MRFFVLGIVAVGSILAALPLRADPCADRNGGADTQGLSKIVITTGAGDLQVLGRAGATRVEASGKACASSEKLLTQIVLQVRREGSVLYVETLMPQLNDIKLFGSVHAELDLKVTLPSNLPIESQDSSGDAELRDLKSLKMLDSSGALSIYNIAELVELRDSSGDIRIERAGAVQLQDSSGNARLYKIAGNVEVITDSSGDMTIEDVIGNVHIAQDSSGDIRIVQVKGNVLIDADTSGGINVRDVGGDFTVGADTSGGINFDNIQGRVTTP